MSEKYPPEGDWSVGAPSPESNGLGTPASEMPEPPRKPKLHWGFALLGFVATATLSMGITFGAAASSSFTESAAVLNIISLITAPLELALFAGVVVAWAVGRKGDNRLRSFGIGGLAMYLALVLVGLLAVGACFVSLGTGGPFGG